MRPVLRPGLRVLRRDDHEIQIGLDPRHAVVLPARPAVMETLSRLVSGQLRLGPGADPYSDAGPDTDGDWPLLRLLASQDLLVDADVLLPLVPVHPGPGRAARPGRHDVAAMALQPGDGTAELGARTGERTGELVARRRRGRVLVSPFGLEDDSWLLAQATGLLATAGIRTGRPSETARADTDLALVAGIGEPRRDSLDPLVRDGIAHLIVRVSEGAVLVGPFVEPGRTACLRCVDAHHRDSDPRWPLLVEQYAACNGLCRPDGVPEPMDSLLTSLAIAWAVRDLVSHLEGVRPSTWSATTRFDPHLAALETRSWQRHPECGCGAWG